MSKIEELIEKEDEAYFTAKEEEYEYKVDQAIELSTDYLTAKQMVEDAKAIMDQLKPQIVRLHAEGIPFSRLSVVHAKKKGSVNTKELYRDYNIMDTDLDKYRGAPSEYDTIRTKK